MPVLHGKNDTLGDYESSAFFIRHDPTRQEFLFFGDVSPDSLASKPQNIAVWRAAAPKIPSTLSAIFIECSWPSGRPDELLYGHLSPEHLAHELAVLAAEVVAFRRNNDAAVAAVAPTPKGTNTSKATDDEEAQAQAPRRPKRRKIRSRNRSAEDSPSSEPLAGLRVYITHCKEDLEQKYSRPICHVIRDQVEALVRARGLGAEVVCAEQGMTISMFAVIFPRALH
jgi:3',5'-cyclic-nucleotide phosphodiesterase